MTDTIETRRRILATIALTLLLSISGNVTAAKTTAPDWAVLKDLSGKVVVVDFWASWCAPCLRSFPWMNELQQRYGSQGLVIVAINMDQDRKLADAFLSKMPAKFRVEYDATGIVARQFGVETMPASFLIDRHGQLRVRHAGFRDAQRAERERQIVQLLKESP